MEKKLRIGVIGLGIMGEQYVRIYQRYPLSEVVAVASRTPEKAAAIAEKYGVPLQLRDLAGIISAGRSGCRMRRDSGRRALRAGEARNGTRQTRVD